MSSHVHLTWDATAFGIRAHHAWVIVPQGDQCRVITEENQVGIVPFFLRRYLTGMLERGHQTWLEGLKDRNGKRAIAETAMSTCHEQID